MTSPANQPSGQTWVKTTLGEAFKWGSGGTPKATEASYYDGDIPWVIIGDLTDGEVHQTARSISEQGLHKSSAKWVEAESVLIAMYGSIGKLGIAKRRLTTNQAIAFTKPEVCTTRYLYYFLMAHRDDLVQLGKGGTQQNISQTVIKAFPFFYPSCFADQRRISAHLDLELSRLDASVSALKRAQANLKRYRAAVLQAAVTGRLVPTEHDLAQAEGREYESGEQLLQRILEERRRTWSGKGKYKEPATRHSASDSGKRSNGDRQAEGWSIAAIEQLSTLV